MSSLSSGQEQVMVITKLYCMAAFNFTSTDDLYLMDDAFIWSRTEESAIALTACAPLLST